MDGPERAAKKIREAERLRDVPPDRTLQMAFDLARAMRKLRAAAERLEP